MIGDDDLNDDGEIELTNPKLIYYAKDSSGCPKGSGYCGCDYYYTITRATVVKNERKITLGR